MATQQQPQQKTIPWPLTDTGRSPYLQKITSIIRQANRNSSENDITQLARKIESAAFSSVCYIPLRRVDSTYCSIFLQTSRI